MGVWMREVDESTIDKARMGDDVAINEICAAYKDFVYLKSRHFFIMGGDRDDVVQEGMVGLLKAIRNYDRQRLASFKSFATLCIQRQVITAIKKANAQKHTAANTSLDFDGLKVMGETNFKGLSAYAHHNPENLFLSKEDISLLSSFLKMNLSEFEFKVFEYMAAEYDYKYISGKLGKSLKSIDNAMQRIRRKGIAWLETREME